MTWYTDMRNTEKERESQPHLDALISKEIKKIWNNFIEIKLEKAGKLETLTLFDFVCICFLIGLKAKVVELYK